MKNVKDWDYARISREARRVTGERARTDGHEAACVIIAGLVVGANARRVAERLGCSVKDIRRYTVALRANSIWKGDKTDGDVVDGMGFNLAVACALGLLQRAPMKKAASRGTGGRA